MNLYISSCTADGGILLYDFENGKFSLRQKLPLDRPMYSVIAGDTLHVVLRAPWPGSEESAVVQIGLNPDGSMAGCSAPEGTGGEEGCHLSVWKGRTFCANYSSGSVSAVGIKTVEHHGSGPNALRQEMAHVHFAAPSPDGKYLLVCDLGMDKVLVYDWDLNLVSEASIPAGHGVRHLVFSEDGKTVYTANELASTVSAFDYHDGMLTYLDTVELLPASWQGENTSAAIRLRKDRLYVSQRGQDAITILDISQRIPRFIGWQSTGGSCPRDFNLVGDYLVCANEWSNSLTAFRMEGDQLVLTDMVSCPSPLCVDYK